MEFKELQAEKDKFTAEILIESKWNLKETQQKILCAYVADINRIKVEFKDIRTSTYHIACLFILIESKWNLKETCTGCKLYLAKY